MKRFTAAILSAAMLLAAAPVMPDALVQSVTAAAEENQQFQETQFFVAVGMYQNGDPQFRYFHLNEDGTYTAEKVVFSTSEEYEYGDILTCKGDPVMTRIQSAPGDPVRAMAYYYSLDKGTKLTKVGSAETLMETRAMTVTDTIYDGSGHFSIYLQDAEGKKYTYGLNTTGSLLPVDLSTAQEGEHVRFAVYQDKLVIPLDRVPADVPEAGKVRKGDVNGDTLVDIMDVITLNKALLGVTELPDDASAAADADGNGEINPGDSLMILKYVLEMIDSLETEETLPQTDSARLLAAPEYPEIPPYPSAVSESEGSDAYQRWVSAVSALRNQPGEYRQGFDTFVKKSTPVFLQDNEGENRVYSPLSLYMALGMSAEVTDGSSRQQILDALDQKDIDTLRSNARSIWLSNYMDDGMAKCVLATSLWTNDAIPYRQKTVDSLVENYYSAVFTGKPGSEDYDKLLQSWLNQQTGGMLEDYVSGITMDPATVLMLASTVDYSGKWHDEFYEDMNKTGEFHGTAGDQSCEFMCKNDPRTYYWGEYYGAISMQLENNGSMRLILPDEGVTPEKLLSDPEVFDFLMNTGERNNATYTKVNLTVPMFDVSSGIDLRSGLEKLGVKDIFDQKKSDFSPLTEDSKGLYVSKAEQDARVMIDENGCKGSAMTVIRIPGAAMPRDEVDFTLDRPFLFEIISETGLPLFIGIVNNVG